MQYTYIETNYYEVFEMTTELRNEMVTNTGDRFKTTIHVGV